MPIEELLKLYYNKAPESKEETNSEENIAHGQQVILIKHFWCKAILLSFFLDLILKFVYTFQDKSEVKTDENETTETKDEPIPSVGFRGEKRGMSTPPPAKKSKSELAK